MQVRSYTYTITTVISLAELGINLTHIRQKTLAVLNPMSRLDPEVIGDRDLAGPIMFCLLLGAILLLVLLLLHHKKRGPHLLCSLCSFSSPLHPWPMRRQGKSTLGTSME